MNAELLRRACEAAGLHRLDEETALIYGRYPGWVVPGWQGVVLPDEHPALPAYVASLLVARVREKAATDEQRIRAALEVLDGQ